MTIAATRLTVFSIREGRNGSIWVRAGKAILNTDGTLLLELDVLPLDGKLHVRETTHRTNERTGEEALTH